MLYLGGSITEKVPMEIKSYRLNGYHYLLLSEPWFAQLNRLGQEYFIDMWSQTEEGKLLWVRREQGKLTRLAVRQELDETVEVQGAEAGRVYLPIHL